MAIQVSSWSGSGVNGPPSAPPGGCCASARGAKVSPTSSAPPALRKSRLGNVVAGDSLLMSAPRHHARRALDRFDDAGICTAAAQMAVHGRANLFDGRPGIPREQLRPFDDLAVVAVAALKRLFIDHGLLQRMQLRGARKLLLLRIPGGQALERRDRFAGDGGQRCDARPYFDSVHEHRTRT